MVSKYPRFEKLTLEKKDEINSFVGKYEPYSDFNFVSLYSWDTQENAAVSVLNGNLVVTMPDYINGNTICTFLGNNEVVKTCTTLLGDANKYGWEENLKLIPYIDIEEEYQKIEREFVVIEDPGNHDYIISVENMILLPGNKFASKRKQIEKFIKNYPNHEVKVIDVTEKGCTSDIENLFLEWAAIQKVSEEDYQDELTAIKRAIQASNELDLINMGIYVKGKLVSFTINELLGQNYYMGHFGKTSYDYYGASKYSEHVTAKHMKNLGCIYMNYEQDLGLENLRDSKSSWKPVRFLKKYVISYKK
jgi:hypothetical protein